MLPQALSAGGGLKHPPAPPSGMGWACGAHQAAAARLVSAGAEATVTPRRAVPAARTAHRAHVSRGRTYTPTTCMRGEPHAAAPHSHCSHPHGAVHTRPSDISQTRIYRPRRTSRTPAPMDCTAARPGRTRCATHTRGRYTGRGAALCALNGHVSWCGVGQRCVRGSHLGGKWFSTEKITFCSGKQLGRSRTVLFSTTKTETLLLGTKYKCDIYG